MARRLSWIRKRDCPEGNASPSTYVYSRVAPGIRRSFGGWVEDADELDQYLDWTREQRKARRREIEE
jgi:hypothetical protein